MSAMACLRQLGLQFPANGRKSNGTSVHRFCSFRLGISSKMPANQLLSQYVTFFLMFGKRGAHTAVIAEHPMEAKRIALRAEDLRRVFETAVCDTHQADLALSLIHI